MKFTWLFWTILACGLLGGTIAGVHWQAEQAQDIVEFRSLAKVVVRWELRGKDGTAPMDADLYGTCIETLESAEMKRRALERVRALNNELADQNVEIRTSRTPGSGIINILATGAEAKYTRIFLDALLDEFMAFRLAVREQEQGRVLQHHLEEVVDLQKVVEQATAGRNRARTASPPTEGPAEVERLIAQLTKLRDHRDDLRTAIRQEAAPEAHTQTDQELKAVDQDIAGCEERITRISTALQAFRDFEEQRSKAVTRYETEFEEIGALQKQFAQEADLVAIHQRATPASMTILRQTVPLILSGFMGAALGGVIGLVAALIASWRPAKVIPLPS